jgi:hypothetical protein
MRLYCFGGADQPSTRPETHLFCTRYDVDATSALTVPHAPLFLMDVEGGSVTEPPQALASVRLVRLERDLGPDCMSATAGKPPPHTP